MNKYFVGIILFLLLQTVGNSQWTVQFSGVTAQLNSVCFISPDTGWCAGFTGKIFNTTNGGINWIRKEWTQNIYDIQFVNNKVGYYCSKIGEDAYVMKTINGGGTWSQVYSREFATPKKMFFVSPDTGCISIREDWIICTTNGGTTWSIVLDIGYTDFFTNITFATKKIGWATAGSNVFDGQKLFKTTNSGLTWSTVYNFNHHPVTYALECIDTLTFFIGGDDGFLVKTTDGGTTWRYLALSDNSRILDIEFADSLHGFLIAGNKTYYTLDGGITWIFYYKRLALFDLFFVSPTVGWGVGPNGVIVKTENGFIPIELISFSGISNGNEIQLSWTTATELNNRGFEVYRKTNNTDWRLLAFIPGAGSSSQTLNYTYKDNSPMDAGIYKYKLKQLDLNGDYSFSKEVEIEFSPSEFLLYQNYPNPFNSNTIIKFMIPEAGFMTLIIYDLMGSKVEELISGYMETGLNEIEFDGANLSSGTYLCKLTYNGNSSVKKMIVLK